jgi:hypothetical protein
VHSDKTVEQQYYNQFAANFGDKIIPELRRVLPGLKASDANICKIYDVACTKLQDAMHPYLYIVMYHNIVKSESRARNELAYLLKMIKEDLRKIVPLYNADVLDKVPGCSEAYEEARKRLKENNILYI